MMAQEELFERPQARPGELEALLLEEGITTVIGVDEAGRGPLAGPVVAAAFWLDLTEEPDDGLRDIDDSKRLDEATREALYDRLDDGDHLHAICACDAGVIDEINVLQATFRAMEMAVEEVIEARGEAPQVVLVDGNLVIPQGPWSQRAIVKGDQRSRAIAAASVMAKVHRDRLMRRAHEEWPHYGFDSNKGYGTAAHREALSQYGPCRLHRRSFAGVVQTEE